MSGIDRRASLTARELAGDPGARPTPASRASGMQQPPGRTEIRPVLARGVGVGGEAPVWIVLASCDGERYLGEQLESIQAQTHSRWRLLLRDDGSCDRTLPLLRDFVAREPRAELLEDARGRLGARRNFGVLLEEALRRGARWIALADQDDVWDAHKLELQLARRPSGASEAEGASGRPWLLHSDLVVAEPDMTPRDGSYARYAGMWHEPERPLATLLVQNFVTGNTCLMNRALVELALPIPEQAVMHDWWLALCAAAAGCIEYLDRPTVWYRQHAGNRIGAEGLFSRLAPLRPGFSPSAALSVEPYLATLRQARSLVGRLAARAEQLDCEGRAQLELARRYCELFEEPRGRLERAFELHALRVGRQGRLRHALWMLKLLARAPRLEVQ